MKTVVSNITAGLLVTLTLFFSVSCQRTEKLIIISTNDMHSAIDNFPMLATVVEQYRAEYPGRVILVDAGDRWTGNPYVDLAPEKYKPMVTLMNELGYDIATFGNHEWDSGNDLLALRTMQFGFRKVLANADMFMSTMPETPGFEFINRGGLKIAFTGLITTAVNGHPDGKDESFGSIVFYDPYETAEKYKWLGGASDLYVAITHTGLEADSLLALQRPEIDLIIGGHSHDVIPVGRKINQTVVTQTGKSLRYVGITTITHSGGKIRSIDNELISLKGVEPHPRFAAMVEEFNNEPELKKVVGTAADDFDKNELMNLFSDILRKETGADIALYNLGSMRINSLAEGNITRADVFSAEPFYNMPMILEMSREDLAELILKKFNSTGKESYTRDIYPSGMEYAIVKDDQGKGVKVEFDMDESIINKQVFRVAMSDYMNSQYNFSKRNTGAAYGKYMTQMIFEYLEKNSPVEPDDEERIEIDD